MLFAPVPHQPRIFRYVSYQQAQKLIKRLRSNTSASHKVCTVLLREFSEPRFIYFLDSLLTNYDFILARVAHNLLEVGDGVTLKRCTLPTFQKPDNTEQTRLVRRVHDFFPDVKTVSDHLSQNSQSKVVDLPRVGAHGKTWAFQAFEKHFGRLVGIGCSDALRETFRCHH